MVIIKPRQTLDRPDYQAACKQTITVYNVYQVDKVSYYHKTVFHESAFMDFKRQWQEATTGITANNSALIVIPQGASDMTFINSISFEQLENKDGYFTLQENDKVFFGEGPDIADVTEWSNFIPTKVHGVIKVNSVDIKRNLAGEIVHIEAGG